MSIELDITPEKRRTQIIRNCGAKPNGEGQLPEDKSRLISYFTDPITRSTLILPIEEISEFNVRRKLHESRLRYGVAILETALIGNLELVAQLKQFLLSLERTRNLPDPIVTAAANAAVMEIVSFESANELDNKSEYHAA